MSTSQSLRLQVILGAVDQLTRPLQGMMQGSHKLSGAVKEARDRLRDLEAQQKRIGNYTGATQALTDNARALGTARDKLRALRDQIIATEQPSRELNEQYKATRREVKQLERDNTRLARTQADARTQIERSGLPVSQLASRQRELAGQIDKANAAISEQGRRLQRVKEFHRKYYEAIKQRDMLLNFGAGSLATGAAMGAPVVAAVKTFATFEDALLGIARQVEGARDANGQLTETYYDMKRGIESLSTQIPMTVTDLAALAEAGARMGIQGKDALLEYVRTAANASTAFGVPAEAIGENIARISDLYQRGFGEVGDVINFLDDQTQAKGDQIIDVLTRIAGVTQTMKMSFKDSAALGTTFLNLGASAEVAATASNAVIRELSIAAMQPDKFQEGLKALGLTADGVQSSMSKDATGTILRVLEAIRKLPDEDKLTVATQLFGKEYGDDVSKLAVKIDKYREALAMANSEEARNSMEREAAARAGNLSSYWQLTLNRLFLASAESGSVLKDSLVSIMDAIGSVLDGVRGFMQEYPNFTSAIMHIAGGAAALAAGIGLAALGIGSIYLPMKLAFGALLALKTIALAHPIVALIAAIASGALLIWQNWEQIEPWLKGLWERIKKFFQDGIDFVMGKIRGLVDAVKKVVSMDFGSVFGAATPATAGAAPLRAPGTASRSTTTSNTITVNAAPGQSAPEVAREVDRQLTERERYRAARRRSILGDVD